MAKETATTTTTPKPAAAPQNGQQTAAKDSRFDGWQQYQAVGSINADGFWNVPKDENEAKAVIGEQMCGILLAEVRTTKDGKGIDNPFYIFELIKDHDRITTRDENRARQIVKLTKGKRVGVSAGWKDLAGLSRKLGYGFVLTFNGKKHFPNGRVGNEINVLCSPKPLREIEPLTPQKSVEGDTGGEGDEIPF